VIEEGIIEEVLEEESSINNNLNIKDIKIVFMSVGWIMLNLSICYYLKYLSTASIADMATKLHNKDLKEIEP